MGSAEWNLLTDEVSWSDELFAIFGRAPADGPLTLDELPSLVHPEDQEGLATMVTDCLVDCRPIDGEFRILRPDGSPRTVHMVGEPVLDADGSTACMWAVLRDVSELRRSQQAVRETRDSLHRERQIAQTEHRLAVELQEAVLPPWRGSLRFPHGGQVALDLAGRYLPSGTRALIGGNWYDALQLPDGSTLLSVGDLTGHGVTATSGMAMVLGALRGMAVAGHRPGPLMGFLNQLLDTAAQPAAGQRGVRPVRPRRADAGVGPGGAPRTAAVPRRHGAHAGPARGRTPRGDLGCVLHPAHRATGARRPPRPAHRRPGPAPCAGRGCRP